MTMRKWTPRTPPTLGTSAAFLACLLLACAGSKPVSDDASAKTALAPSGRLRMALYPGTPTSILDPGTERARGVGYDLGRVLARRASVPFEPVVLPNNAAVLAAVKEGKVDLAFTNATAERARDMDFTPPCLEIELGYLVRRDAPLATPADVDRPGVRVGVTAKSSSDVALTRDLKHATVVRAATLDAGSAMLAAGAIDAYATNKATLFEMGEKVAGSRVLDGRWGVERMALAVPKGRPAALSSASAFVEAAKRDGVVNEAIARAGLRGAIPAPAAPGHQGP